MSAQGRLAAAEAAGAATPVLRLRGLTKQFGAITAVRGLDLDLYPGEVFGFLGPNGAGKSTTIGMILGLIRPTAGTVEAFGLDLSRHRWEVLRRVGAVVETPAFYGHLSGRDNLRAIALAVGGVPERRIDELLELVGLADRARDKFKTYSLGMKQRLGIASTLLADPQLVLLDEPTNGLDPAGQREVRELIPRLAAEGRTVLLASHLLYEVQQVCQRVAILQRGELVAAGRVEELLRQGRRLEVEVRPEELDRAQEILSRLPGVESVERRDGRLLLGAAPELGRTVNLALAREGIFANQLRLVENTLEEYFLQLTGEEGNGDQRPAQ
ncbi:MAG TPA: ABC transporter ATP-binding protein [Dehalococcoidia bacterium]